ncbi:hypothetical protein MKX03_000203 [Papaver bracteatum]|nr:hypothetical protein MKX03_000203 [Papaver bracteatum]
MQSSLLNSTLSLGPCAFNKPYNESSLFPKNNPFLHSFAPPKKLLLKVSHKKQKSLVVKSSIKDFVKTSAVLTNQMFQSLASFDKWIFQSLSNFIAFKSGGRLFEDGDFPLFKEEDLIQIKHNGKCIVGVVQHIGFLETTLIGPIGLIILQNSKIDLCAIINFTKIMGSEKLFGFHANAISFGGIILVSCYVNCSKLQIPQFKSYLQFGGQVLTAIDRIGYGNKAVANCPTKL